MKAAGIQAARKAIREKNLGYRPRYKEGYSLFHRDHFQDLRSEMV